MTLELLVRQGCHACAEAEAALAAYAGTGWTRIDVDSDPELRMEWGDMVPVLRSAAGHVFGWGMLSAAEIQRAVGQSHG